MSSVKLISDIFKARKTKIFVVPNKYNDGQLTKYSIRMIDGKKFGISFYENFNGFLVSDLDQKEFFGVGLSMSAHELRSFDVCYGMAYVYYFNLNPEGNHALVFYGMSEQVVRVEKIEADCEFVLSYVHENSTLVVGVAKDKMVIFSDVFGVNEFREEVAINFQRPIESLCKIISSDEILIANNYSWKIVDLQSGNDILNVGHTETDYFILDIKASDKYVVVITPKSLSIFNRENSDVRTVDLAVPPCSLLLDDDIILVGSISGDVTVFKTTGENYKLKDSGYLMVNKKDLSMKVTNLIKIRNYVILFCSGCAEIYYLKIPNSLLLRKKMKKVEDPIFLLTKDLDIDVIYNKGSFLYKKEFKPKLQTLSSIKKKFVKSEKYDLISESPTLSPTIIQYILQDDEFLIQFMKIASDLVTNLNVIDSLLKVLNEKGLMKNYIEKMIQEEFDFLPEYVKIKVNGHVKANEALKSIFYQESGYNDIDALLSEMRFITRTFDRLFSTIGDKYFKSNFKDIISRVLEEREILEVDPRLLRIYLERKGADVIPDEVINETVSENVEKLIGFAYDILECLENSATDMPPLMITILNRFHRKITRRYNERGRISRLSRGANRILYWLWLAQKVVNPPFGTRRNSTQQRNLSILANMIEMEAICDKNTPDYAAVSEWDKKGRIHEISYKLTRAEEDDLCWSDPSLLVSNIDYVVVAEYFKSIASKILKILPEETKSFVIWSKIAKDDTLVLTNRQEKYQDESPPELDGMGPACYRVQSKGGVDYFQRIPPLNINFPVTPVTYDTFLSCNPLTYNDYSEWFFDEIKHHEYTVLVVYRGKVCGWCHTYMMAWNKYFLKILGNGGMLVGYSLESQKVANMVITEWDIDYPQLGEPGNILGSHFNIKVSAIGAIGFANGLSQPAVIVKSRNGDTIFQWTCLPSLTNNTGAVGRPRPRDVMDSIEDYFYRYGEMSDSELDNSTDDMSESIDTQHNKKSKMGKLAGTSYGKKIITEILGKDASKSLKIIKKVITINDGKAETKIFEQALFSLLFRTVSDIKSRGGLKKEMLSQKRTFFLLWNKIQDYMGILNFDYDRDQLQALLLVFFNGIKPIVTLNFDEFQLQDWQYLTRKLTSNLFLDTLFLHEEMVPHREKLVPILAKNNLSVHTEKATKIYQMLFSQ